MSKRKRKCEKRDGSDVTSQDCSCQEITEQHRECNTSCCPTWHICPTETSESIGIECSNENNWIPQNSSVRHFSACPDCGEGEQITRRQCKCKQTETGKWKYGNLNLEKIIINSCSLYSKEMKIITNLGFPYEARETKKCTNQPCCGGWTSWSEWQQCAAQCYDHRLGSAPTQLTERSRSCGCKGNVVNVDSSRCLGVSSQLKTCPGRSVCPFWSSWSNPTPCPVTCHPVRSRNSTGLGLGLGNFCIRDQPAQQLLRRHCVGGEVGDGECSIEDAIEKPIPCSNISTCCLYSQWQEWKTCQRFDQKT